jgi:hypothetical protein
MVAYRLTAQGTLPGEVFNFGLHVTHAAAAAAAAQSAWNTALTAAWTDGTNGLNALISATTEIVVGRASELDPLTGKQVDAAEGVLALAGTNAGQTLPNEVACAVTYRCAAILRKDRGRSFLPPFAVGELSSGRFTTAACTRAANAMKIALDSLQGAGFTPVVYHPKDKTTTVITTIDVGDVPDAQRRRRDKLVEVRVSVGV